MQEVILQAAGLIVCGVLWRIFRPLGLDADEVRRHLTGVVYVLMLPSLVLVVLWRAPLGLDAVRVAGVAASAVVSALIIAWLWYRGLRAAPTVVGAMLLASAFPNATYLGLPVLEAALGPLGRSIAIQYDLFACTPLLLSVGVLLAERYGGHASQSHPLLALARVPPLWAAVIAIGLNLAGTTPPAGLVSWLEKLGGAVVPLMLFALGLGLTWRDGIVRRLPLILPALTIQLLITPLLMLPVARAVGLDGAVLTGVILEAAMPSMVLGIVLCDRYRLDAPLYAVTVTVSTAIALISLPIWFQLLGSG